MIAYLDAHDEGRDQDARNHFATDTVVDDGNTYRGIEKIAAWIERSASEFEDTSTRIGQRQDDDTRVTVRFRIDSTFAGGTATLSYRLSLDAERITGLAIEARPT